MKLLLCADLHLRHDMPICRRDADWMESQRRDLEIIGDIAKAEKVDDIWLLGDIFHRPVEPPEVVNMFIRETEFWPHRPWILCGNHDLKYHNIELKNECSIGTVLTQYPSLADEYPLLNVAAWDFGTEADAGCAITAIHKLVFPAKNELVPNSLTADDIFKMYPSSRLIVMGDYHDGWEVKQGDRLAIMCGCMNIQSAALASYTPHVVIIDTNTLEYKLVPLENDLAVISTEHIESQKHRDERLENCLQIAGMSADTSLDFMTQLYGLVEQLDGKQKELVTQLIEELNKETK